MVYRDKYFHNNIAVSILAYHDNHENDNTIDTITTKSLPAMQCSGCNLKMYVYSTTCTQCITIVSIMIRLVLYQPLYHSSCAVNRVPHSAHALTVAL